MSQMPNKAGEKNQRCAVCDGIQNPAQRFIDKCRWDRECQAYRHTKQVIILRKNFVLADGTTISYKTIHRGKLVTQGAHAAVRNAVECAINVGFRSAMNDWMDGSGNETKITLAVDDEESLVKIYDAAMQSGFPASLVRDAGLSEFKGEQMLTAVAIGPWWTEQIDYLTKDLALL